MKRLLKPKIYLESVFMINIGILKKYNIKGIIIDIDNTLVPWGAKNINNRAYELISKLKNEGFRICILSNNTKKRVDEFNKDLNLPAVYNAGKPRKSAYKKALSLLQTDIVNTAVIGDQIFTDILGGNRLGLFTILVNPIDTKEFFGTRLVRILERLVLKRL
ncbi:MAG: YqeG family HAD IIIA-type phosphatase [Firmicutes bacterium]|nr:YqeG family HAD IIIA-type phosphatase [Bacillota bacterium]